MLRSSISLIADTYEHSIQLHWDMQVKTKQPSNSTMGYYSHGEQGAKEPWWSMTIQPFLILTALFAEPQ
jgi:hypothetical protein